MCCCVRCDRTGSNEAGWERGAVGVTLGISGPRSSEDARSSFMVSSKALCVITQPFLLSRQQAAQGGDLTKFHCAPYWNLLWIIGGELCYSVVFQNMLSSWMERAQDKRNMCGWREDKISDSSLDQPQLPVATRTNYPDGVTQTMQMYDCTALEVQVQDGPHWTKIKGLCSLWRF